MVVLVVVGAIVVDVEVLVLVGAVVDVLVLVGAVVDVVVVGCVLVVDVDVDDVVVVVVVVGAVGGTTGRSVVDADVDVMKGFGGFVNDPSYTDSVDGAGLTRPVVTGLQSMASEGPMLDTTSVSTTAMLPIVLMCIPPKRICYSS